MMDAIASGRGHEGDDRATYGPSLEERRKQLAARAQAARERSEEAKQRLELLTSMSRAFASAMRTTAFEHQRLAEERERLLERERATRAEVEASRKKLSGVLESIGDAFFAVDQEGCFTYINRHAEQLWGCSREELLGRKIWKELPQMIGPEPYRQMKRAAEEGVTTEFEALSPVLGTWIAGRVYPSSDGLSVYFQDVTKRKRAEEERERFLARELVAHAEAEERRMISRELHDRVAHSMAVVHQSLQLYKALLPRDPSQAEAKLALASEMAKKALDSTRNLAMALRDPVTGSSGLKEALLGFLGSTVPPDIETDLSVEGDESSVPINVREQLFLILREALRNAVSHSGCGRISVRLEVIPEKVAGIVEDDGRGFTLEDPMGVHGTGLGSMEERAALVGGTCSVQSELNEGTCVQVSIPLTQDR